VTKDLSADEIVRFSVFEVDVMCGELRRQGLKVPLPEQPFRVLARLLQRPGLLVTRVELRANLWPADTFVDFEQGLNTAIYKIRRALADSAASPRFVETLARHGYRFIAPIQMQLRSGSGETSAGNIVDWESFWRGFLGDRE
jgi:cholera toxin transcriptional activator